MLGDGSRREKPARRGTAKCMRHHGASPWASACRKDVRDAGAGEGRAATAGTGWGHRHRGSLQRAAPCWPWRSGTAEGRKDAAAGAKDTLGSGNGRSPGDEDQQTWEAAAPPLPARKGRRQASEWVAAAGAALPKPRGARDAGAGLSCRQGPGMSAAGSRVEWPGGGSRPDAADTEMSGEGLWLHPCLPLQKFPALSPTTSFPPECPSSSPHPLHALPRPPARSVTAPPACTAPRCRLLQWWGSPWLSWCLCPCPLCCHPYTLQQSPCRGGQAELAGVAAEIKSSSLAPKFSLWCKSSRISKLKQAAALPWEEGEAKPSRASKPMRTQPNSHSNPAGPPQDCPVTPGPPQFLPSLVVAERQAAKAMTMESEDIRSPCAHAMVQQGHQARDRATSVVPAPLRASARRYGTRRLMQRHFAHIARIHTGERLGREGAACLSPLASQWGGWALQQAPLPTPHAHAGPARASGRRAPAPPCPLSSLPRDAQAAPVAPRAPRLSSLLPSSCCESQTCSPSCGPAGSSVPTGGQA